VGAVVWGERTAGAVGAAGVAVGKRTVEQRCQRCCGDIVVGVVGGCGEIVRRHGETGLSVREIGGGEGDAGVGEAVVSLP
jgi:hypothetical protein